MDPNAIRVDVEKRLLEHLSEMPNSVRMICKQHHLRHKKFSQRLAQKILSLSEGVGFYEEYKGPSDIAPLLIYQEVAFFSDPQGLTIKKVDCLPITIKFKNINGYDLYLTPYNNPQFGFASSLITNGGNVINFPGDIEPNFIMIIR